MLIGDTTKIELEFGNVGGFLGEGKTGVPGEKPLGAGMRTNNKINPRKTPGPASVLTTAPSLLPRRICVASNCVVILAFNNMNDQPCVNTGG